MVAFAGAVTVNSTALWGRCSMEDSVSNNEDDDDDEVVVRGRKVCRLLGTKAFDRGDAHKRPTIRPWNFIVVYVICAVRVRCSCWMNGIKDKHEPGEMQQQNVNC